MQLLTPKARQTLAKLPGGEDAKGEKSEAPASSSAVPPIAKPETSVKKGDAPPEDLIKGLPDGTKLSNEHGERYEVKNGKAVKIN
jgi:hypothetical protein